MKLIAGALGLGCLYLIFTKEMPAWLGGLCLLGVVTAIIFDHMAG